MEGTIANFRRNRHTQSSNHMIVQVEGVDDRKKADSLVGKKAVWKNPEGKDIEGKVAAAHGNSGAVRVIFSTGMPGQAKGSKVQIE